MDLKKLISQFDFKRFGQYAIVGFISYGITASFLEVFYQLGLSPGWATLAASEIAIVFNFFVNNFWTFKDKRVSSRGKILAKLIQFNLATQAAAIISSSIVGALAWFFGDQWRHFYLIFAIGFFVIPCNFSMYNLFIWKTWQPDIKAVKWLQKKLG